MTYMIQKTVKNNLGAVFQFLPVEGSQAMKMYMNVVKIGNTVSTLNTILRY